MITFGTPVITGELAPIPLTPTPGLQPPPAAMLDVFWGETLVGTMARFDWFDTTTSEPSHRTYEFRSCSGNTVLAAGNRDALIELVVERLKKCDSPPAVPACGPITADEVPY
jgi:hypothetical protein